MSDLFIFTNLYAFTNTENISVLLAENIIVMNNLLTKSEQVLWTEHCAILLIDDNDHSKTSISKKIRTILVKIVIILALMSMIINLMIMNFLMKIMVIMIIMIMMIMIIMIMMMIITMMIIIICIIKSLLIILSV